MKKLFLTCFIVVIAMQASAQLPRTMELQKQNTKLISPSDEVNIRNNLSALKAQSAQLCDSVAMLQQKINDSVKELQSQGTSNEQAKAMVMQQYADRINRLMTMLSNMLRKMHETSASIIGNLK